jgi:hypothetical protein
MEKIVLFKLLFASFLSNDQLLFLFNFYSNILKEVKNIISIQKSFQR